MSNIPYQKRDIDQYTDSLSRYLPNDELFNGKNNVTTNIRKFLKGLSFTLLDVNGTLKEMTEDYTPDITQKFINEWEKAVGIPDECFSNEETDATRRLQIIAKLSYMACQIANDFVELADLLGFTITVTPGIEDVSGVTAGLTDTQKRFTIVINTLLPDVDEFPLTFPLFFGTTSEVNFLRCLFSRVEPGNCQVLFNNQG